MFSRVRGWGAALWHYMQLLPPLPFITSPVKSASGVFSYSGDLPSVLTALSTAAPRPTPNLVGISISTKVPFSPCFKHPCLSLISHNPQALIGTFVAEKSCHAVCNRSFWPGIPRATLGLPIATCCTLNGHPVVLEAHVKAEVANCRTSPISPSFHHSKLA